jgi:hypothetical protein
MQVVDVNGNMFGYDFLEVIGIDGKPKTPGGGGGPYVPYTGATGNVDLGEYELKAGQLELDQTPTGTAGVAVMRWNDQDGTVDLGLKGGNVTLQVGQEEVIRVVNKAGVNLLEANYQCVRVRTQAEGGAQGQRLAVKLAQANNKANHTGILGLVTETINNNQEGFITTFGEVKEINTTGSIQGETWLDGDVLWLSETTAGQLTNIEPNTHPVQIGYVIYAHANNGKIFVSVSEGVDQLNELHDVAITSVANNDILQYDSATSLWKNESLSAAGIQPTITLTTTGTSGPATLVGSTLNIPEYAGGGGSGLQGIHSVMPLISGDATTFTVTSPTWSGTNWNNSRLVLVPYIPAQTINSDALQYFVNINVAGSLCRLLIYSDLNGVPNTKLYESSDINCSTTGLKTVLNSFTFNSGTRYWIAFHGGLISSGTINVTGAGMMPIKSSGTSTPQTYTYYYVSVALGSAPTTITTRILSGGNVPYVGIRIA